MTIQERIARNITELVKQSGKTQRQIAVRIGVHESTIGNYMNGDSIPRTVQLGKLCIALNCTYEDILGKP